MCIRDSSSNAPFGYQKDPADHNHLVIDPNTAPVVEYIYSMAEEGLGLHRIACLLYTSGTAVFLSSGHQLPISRRKRQEFNQIFNAYLGR